MFLSWNLILYPKIANHKYYVRGLIVIRVTIVDVQGGGASGKTWSSPDNEEERESAQIF